MGDTSNRPVIRLAAQVFTAIQAVWKMGTIPKTSRRRVIAALIAKEEYRAVAWVETWPDLYMQMAMGSVSVELISQEPVKLKKEPFLPGSIGRRRQQGEWRKANERAILSGMQPPSNFDKILILNRQPVE